MKIYASKIIFGLALVEDLVSMPSMVAHTYSTPVPGDLSDAFF